MDELNTLELDDLMNKLKSYNPEAIPMVKKAYELAEKLHAGQFRKSGEPYIIHPLNVAYILSELHADCDTICAGLLHDTLEDTEAKKELLLSEFNEDVANLVDGVTKINNTDYINKEAIVNANTRKIVTSIMDDVRIVIIKLADRLHNMRTLQYKSEAKQKEKSIETLKIFVPLAYYIGAYRIRNELEDICLKYLKPEEYKEIEDLRQRIEVDSKDCLLGMRQTIKDKLDEYGLGLTEEEKKANIENVKIRIKNVYGIYRKIKENPNIKREDIHDLLILKVLLHTIPDCYVALGIVHSQYNPINDKFKDYMFNPKTNMYRSIHTTVFAPDDKVVQAQIRTFEIDKVDSFGITTYWHIKKGQARYEMQEALTRDFQFFKPLNDMNKKFSDDAKFVNHITEELFEDMIYVKTKSGISIELPKGSCPIDLAYRINDHLGNTIIGAKVNKVPVGIDYKLKNDDIVDILSDTSSRPAESWLPLLKTSYAKDKVTKYLENEKKYILKQ